jgi:hypothetical protein
VHAPELTVNGIIAFQVLFLRMYGAIEAAGRLHKYGSVTLAVMFAVVERVMLTAMSLVYPNGAAGEFVVAFDSVTLTAVPPVDDVYSIIDAGMPGLEFTTALEFAGTVTFAVL